MKLFHFYRVEDQSGVSGTGPVVEGVEFTNGWCALRWISNKSSVCFYQSLEEVKAIHGHGGKTEIIVHDFEPSRRPRTEEDTGHMELLSEIIEEASRAIVLAEEPHSNPSGIHEAIDAVRARLDVLEKRLQKGRRQKGRKSAA